MNFMNPLGFIALLGIPIIIILYILKQKFKPHTVGSMALWNKVIRQSEGHKWRQKLKRNLLMFLQIVAFFLFVLALARPLITSIGEKSNIILVVDTSTSMAANDVAPTRLDKAKEEAKELVKNAPEGTFFTLVVFNNNPYTALAMTQEKYGITSAIEGLKNSHTGSDVQRLKAVLKGLNAEETGQLYMFTDKTHNLEIDGITTAIYGDKSLNYGITNVAQRDNLVMVKVFANNQGNCDVSLFADGVILDTETAFFNAEGTYDVVFNVGTEEYKFLTAKIIGEDALAVDNSYIYAGSSATPIKAMLVSQGNIFVEKAVSLIDGVELFKKADLGNEVLEGYNVYIFDGVLPNELPTDGHIWLIDPPANNGLIEVSAGVDVDGTSFVGNVLRENIDKLSFPASDIKIATPPPWGKTVLTSDAGALIVMGEKNGQKICVFSFDIHKTQLPLLKEFPILVYNIMNAFSPQQGAEVEGIYAGNLGEISILPKTISAKLTTPSNKEEVVNVGTGINKEFQEIGEYVVTQEMSDGTTEEVYFAVNPVTNGESSLETGEETTGEIAKGGIKTGKSLVPIIILIALIVMGIEWWVKWRDK